MEKESEYFNVPIYIEKAIKKLFKLRKNQQELVSQIKDYMETRQSRETEICFITPSRFEKCVERDEQL